jgi:hypothetical protein
MKISLNKCKNLKRQTQEYLSGNICRIKGEEIPHPVKQVRLLDAEKSLKWEPRPEGLWVKLPKRTKGG